jgi:hypothetical protein
MNPEDQLIAEEIKRRTFLRQSAMGLGGLALGSLLQRDVQAGSATATRWPGAINPLHLAPKCKRVIFLCMAGGPSHLETFDYKPELAKLDGKPMPKSFTEGQQLAQLQGAAADLKILGPTHPFARHGKSGQEICSVLPHISTLADDICIIRSMQTDQINHDPAHMVMNTGTSLPGRPAMGSWINYGLGNGADDLPGFVVLTSVGGGQSQPIAARQWHSGFLPSQFQGVRFQSHGDPVLYVRNPAGVGRQQQRQLVDTVKELNSIGDETFADPEITTRIRGYEMAFRMQASVPELMDISKEPKHILEMYGTQGGDGTFAGNCLLARRMAERGVRFIQLYHRGWDHHGGIKDGIPKTAKYVDQATAALVNDLKQRGMLDETLIVWGGEFGRTPMAQGDGRDHHIKAGNIFMCGGGVKGGISHGATDELGYDVVKDPVHVRDLHATILHQLGIDHKRLSVKFQGLDVRLTGVEEAHVLKTLLT